MNFFKRLWQKSSAEGETDLPEPARLAHEPDAMDLEALLYDLEKRRDAGGVLEGLDRHLERLQEHGYGDAVGPLVHWVDAEMGQEDTWSSDRLSQLGSLFQRLDGDRRAHCQRALELYARALEGHQQADEGEWEAVILNNMGLALVELGGDTPEAFRQAIPLLEEALAFFEGGDDLTHRGAICMSLGEAYAGLKESGADHLELARECYERAWALFERCGWTLDQAAAQVQLGDTQAELAAFYGPDALEKGIRHYRNALDIYLEQDDSAVCGPLRRRLGAAYATLADQRGEPGHQALGEYERALDAFRRSGDSQAAAHISLELAELHLHLKGDGDYEQLAAAHDRFREALDGFGQAGFEGDRARALHGLARVYLEQGTESERPDLEQAVRLLEEAVHLLGQASLSREFQLVNEQLRQARSLLARVSS